MSRQSKSSYSARPVPDDEVREQQDAYGDLLGDLGSASHAEIKAALAEREAVKPEPGLTPEVVERLRARRGRTAEG